MQISSSNNETNFARQWRSESFIWRLVQYLSKKKISIKNLFLQKDKNKWEKTYVWRNPNLIYLLEYFHLVRDDRDTLLTYNRWMELCHDCFHGHCDDDYDDDDDYSIPRYLLVISLQVKVKHGIKLVRILFNLRERKKSWINHILFSQKSVDFVNANKFKTTEWRSMTNRLINQIYSHMTIVIDKGRHKKRHKMKHEKTL